MPECLSISDGEVSSIALERIVFMKLRNLMKLLFTKFNTRPFKDFHKTLENYANAKQLLFKRQRGKKIAIINGDDPMLHIFELEGNQKSLISDPKGDVLIQNIRFSHLGTTLLLISRKRISNTFIFKW